MSYYEYITREDNSIDIKHHLPSYTENRYLNYYDNLVLLTNTSFTVTITTYNYYAYDSATYSYKPAVPYITVTPVTLLVRAITETKSKYRANNWGLYRNSTSIAYYENTYYEFTETTNLYIIWSVDTALYTINWNGSYITTIIQYAQYNQIINVPDPILSGYTLEGWYTNSFFTGTKYIRGSFFNFKPINNVDIVILYFAKWINNTYTVIWNTNEGVLTGSIPKTVTYDVNMTPPNATRLGYTLNTWYINDSLTGSNYPPGIAFNYNYPNTTNFYADWTPNTYNITWVLNGGTLSSVAVSSIQYSSYLIFPTASRIDFELDGWYTTSNFTSTKFLSSATEKFLYNNNISFYAKWKGDLYIITWVTNGGIITENAQTIVMYLDDLKFPYIYKTGNTFGGWYANSIYSGTSNSIDSIFNYNLKTDSTYYAKFIINSYLIKWDSNGGTLVATPPTTINFGDSILMPNVIKTDNIFNGWYSNASFTGYSFKRNELFVYNITTNITFYSKWTDEPTAISWDLNGGILYSGTLYTSYTINTEFTFPYLYDRKGYYHAYWYTRGDFTGTNYSQGQSIMFTWNVGVVFYAYFRNYETKIIWSLDGGIFQETNIYSGTFPNFISTGNYISAFFQDSLGSYIRYYKYNSVMAPPRVIKTNYNLLGWKILENDYKWYSVDGTTNDVTDVIYTIPFISFFESSQDIILTAIWEPIKYTLFWNGNYRGSTTIQQKVENGEYISLLYDIERKGYTFDSWKYRIPNTSNPTQYITYETDFIYEYTNDIVLSAFWNINSYTVTWDLRGAQTSSGSYFLTTTARYDTTVTAFTTISFAHTYVYKGWTVSGGTLPILINPGSSFKMPDSNLTYYVYLLVRRKVIWNYGYGNTLMYNGYDYTKVYNDWQETLVMDESQILPPLIPPRRSGYKFMGWSSNETSITSVETFPIMDSTYISTRYFALWNALSNVINFTSPLLEINKSLILQTDSTTVVPNLKLIGYTFNGWYNAESNGALVVSGGGTYTIPSQSITLYANITQTNGIKFSNLQSTFGGTYPISIGEYQESISRTSNIETSIGIDFKGKGPSIL